MLSLLIKLLLVFTTIAPAFLTYSFILAREGGTVAIPIVLVGVSILLSIACFCIIRASESRLYRTTVRAETVRPSDKEISGYFVAYLIPLIGGGNYFSDGSVFVFFSIMFFLFVFYSKSFYANPILSLFGYRFHEVQLSTGMAALLLTSRKIYKADDISEVVYLTDHTMLDLKKGK